MDYDLSGRLDGSGSLTANYFIERPLRVVALNRRDWVKGSLNVVEHSLSRLGNNRPFFNWCRGEERVCEAQN
jgi:hypothetical protein